MAEQFLIWIIFFPLLGAIATLLVNKRLSGMVALAVSIIPFVLNIVVYLDYVAKATQGSFLKLLDGGYDRFIYYISAPWINSSGYDIGFSLGMDGISVFLVLLTTLLFPISIYFSMGSIKKNEQGYYALLLVLEAGVIGFFLALDMLLFYVFFEMVLIPMYFLIGIWGGKDKIYASLKFFLYTLVGSLLMLVAIIYLCLHVEGFAFTTDYIKILNGADVTLGAQRILFLAFFLSFAVKVPLFPVHTWLPDAHTQAPTAGSVILAGVLLKMGTYGIVRFCLPIFPEASLQFAPVMSFLAVVGIIYGAMAAMVQTDVKKLVAYSSVSHLGFIVLGIFAFTEEGMNGAIMQMVNHGLATGGLFLLVGMIYDRRHTRAIDDFQGIAKVMPRFTFLFLFTVMASVGLPGLNGFVGEFLVLMGAFKSSILSGALAVFAATGVVIAAVYLLWMFRRVMFGELDKDENKSLVDLNSREVLVMMPLVILMLVMGLWATPFLKQIGQGADPLVQEVVKHANVADDGHHASIPVYKEGE